MAGEPSHRSKAVSNTDEPHLRPRQGMQKLVALIPYRIVNLLRVYRHERHVWRQGRLNGWLASARLHLRVVVWSYERVFRSNGRRL